MAMGLYASANVVRNLKQNAKAALGNEYLTRQRVDRLEAWQQAFLGMGFWRRWRWLLLGR